MTAGQPVGAPSAEGLHWARIDWRAVHREVYRLQVRIAKAVREGRWGKVKALQRLLTHSYAAKQLAVRRVVTNPAARQDPRSDPRLRSSLRRLLGAAPPPAMAVAPDRSAAAVCPGVWRGVRRCAIVTASTALVTVRRVSQPNQVLEPCAGKLARTVPRGRGTGNRLLLPGVPSALRAPAAG